MKHHPCCLWNAEYLRRSAYSCAPDCGPSCAFEQPHGEEAPRRSWYPTVLRTNLSLANTRLLHTYPPTKNCCTVVGPQLSGGALYAERSHMSRKRPSYNLSKLFVRALTFCSQTHGRPPVQFRQFPTYNRARADSPIGDRAN